MRRGVTASPPLIFRMTEERLTEIKNEIRAIPIREGVTMGEAVRRLSEQYGRSGSVPNFSEKLRRSSLKYREACEIVWEKRGERCG